MINRAYLPFQSAREYKDRGMVKWSGFFLSEHTSALSARDEIVDFPGQMEWEIILFLLEQFYKNGQKFSLYRKGKQGPCQGKIIKLFRGKFYFQTEEGRRIQLSPEEIIAICPLEEVI